MNLDNNIGYLIQHTSALLARQSGQILQEQLGIGYAQFKIMLILEQSTGAQQRKIAELLGQTEASISRQIKLLQNDGLLESRVNPSNRRQHIIRLTPRGLKFTTKALEILNKYYTPRFAGLSDRQQYQLRELLTALNSSLTRT